MFVKLVICFVSVGLISATLTSEEVTEVTESCCGHAEVVAVTSPTAAACQAADVPDYLEPDQEDTCRAAMKSCCESQFKDKDACAAGMTYAASKRCSVPSTDVGKTCCEECGFGRSAGEIQGKDACGSPPDGDGISMSSFLRKDAYYKCCLEAAEKPETTTEKKSTTTSTTTARPKPKDKCKSDSCAHNCDDSDGFVRCSCREGFRLQADKKSCIDINECLEAQEDLCISEDTVCHNIPGAFKCVPIKKRDVGLTCPPGFKRNVENQVCDDINECHLPRPPCPKYLCENTIGGYKCAGKPGKPFEELVPGKPGKVTEPPPSEAMTPKNDICPPGFRGGADDECTDIDECSENLDDCQRLSQHCINTHGNFFCQDHVSKRCAPGFKVNSGTGICEDIDECEESSEVCKRTEVCVNLPGAYNCKSKISQLPKLATKTCQEGTRLRPGGKICEDIDECREGTHLCDQFQNCINTFGAHECRCKNGFELDSSSGSCMDIDECTLKLDNCGSGLRCLNVLGSFTCTRQAATSSTTPPPLYEYEYYDSEEENNTNEVLPPTTSTPKPTTTSTTTTTTTTTPKPTTTSTTTTTTTTTPKPTTTSTTVRPRPTYPRYTTSTPRPTRRPYTPYRPRPETTPKPPTPEESPEPKPDDRTTPEYRPAVFNPHGPSRPVDPVEENSQPEDPRRPNEYPRRPETPRRPPVRGPPYRRPNSRRPTTTTPIPTTTAVSPGFDPNDVHCLYGFEKDEFGNCVDASLISRRPNIRPETTTVPPTPTPAAPGFDPNQHCLFGFEQDEFGNCVDVNECERGQHVCDSLEVCVNRAGGYSCDCIAGFQRSDDGWCAVAPTSTSVSTSSTASPNAVDYSPEWSYTPETPRPPAPRGGRIYPATCELGFTFDSVRDKCVDVDECAENKDTCSALEDCVNMDGGFRCVCGRRCRAENERPTYVPVQPPVRQPSESGSNVITVGSQYGQRGPWSPRPTFTRMQDSILTACPWGYKLTPEKRCYDVDECARNTSSCGPQQRCENFYGGYSCQCPAGHKLVGQNGCEDIDECVHGNPCSYNSQCINTVGSYRCECTDGFRNAPSNDKVCVDVDECTETPQVCEHSCANAWGGYRCYCRRGYRLASDNRTCSDVNECEEWSAMRGTRARLCGGECVNEPGSYRCSCPPGYRLSEDQRSCIDIDECESGEASCAHTSDPGQVCQNTRGSYHCHQIECPDGYRLESKHRCARIQRSCAISDWTCLQQPGSYSYNFITFVSNIYLPSGSVDLFTMHGPSWSDAVVSFEMRMLRVKAGRGVQPTNLRCFDMRPSGNVCVISLLCSLQGPQVAELELSMSLYQRGVFAGSTVARLVVIVSEYEF